MEVDPTRSPRHLGGEVIDDSDERDAEKSRISRELGENREDEEMYASEAWKRFRDNADRDFKDAVARLVTSGIRDPQADAEIRGKAVVYQWILALPEEARTERTRLSDQYRALEAPPEEEVEA